MADGIQRLAIPTPFAVGRVNLYLIEDDPLTLVDAGPNSGRSLDELESQLRAHGHRLEGLTVDLGDWWFNHRPSNTEPLMRLNLEARPREACDARTAEVLAHIRKDG